MNKSEKEFGVSVFDLKKALEQMETPKPATEKEWADLYYSAKDAVREIEMYKDAIFGEAGWKRENERLKEIAKELIQRSGLDHTEECRYIQHNESCNCGFDEFEETVNEYLRES